MPIHQELAEILQDLLASAQQSAGWFDEDGTDYLDDATIGQVYKLNARMDSTMPEGAAWFDVTFPSDVVIRVRVFPARGEY
jgi:hypothetical protein